MDFRKKKINKRIPGCGGCGGLDKNGLHGPMDLNAEASGRGTISEGSGGVALLKEVCHWGGL